MSLYPTPPDVPVPANAKKWGFTEIKDPRWTIKSNYHQPIAIGGISPDYDNMKITAINFYWIDFGIAVPFAKFAVYVGGSDLDTRVPRPLNAVKLGQTKPHSYNRENGVLNSHDGNYF